MRDLIHALKYGRLRPAARELGRVLATVIAQLRPEAPPEAQREMLVVPISLHRAKQSEGGFNQARLIAAEAVAVLRREVPDWRLILAPSTLIRIRATESQTGLTTRQRRLNLRGAFQVSDPSLIAGRHILLVDHILTIGATARAASRVLFQASAEFVRVATLARAHRTDRAFDRSFAASEGIEVPKESLAAVVVHERATMNSQSQPSF